MTKHFCSFFHATLALLIFCATSLLSAAPEAIHYQGQVTVDGSTFDGTGYFKFAIVKDGTENVATATATVINGFITAITVHGSGSGYTTPPEIRLTGNGSGATANAVVEGGEVVEIHISNTGSGYSSVTKVDIKPPPSATIQTLWNNAQGAIYGSTYGVSEPEESIALAVSQGVFSVALENIDRPDVFRAPPGFFANLVQPGRRCF